MGDSLSDVGSVSESLAPAPIIPRAHRQVYQHHRKRASTTRLSSDTTTTLPEYTRSPPPRSTLLRQPSAISSIFPEEPPGYSASGHQSHEEQEDGSADADDEDPHRDEPPSRRRRFLRRHRSSSSSDPYLDSLLARSVHALELSNALLQSTMTTQSSLSAVLSTDNSFDRSLEQQARFLSRRIQGAGNVHETWMDDLDEVVRGVEGLFQDGGRENGMPRSLPTGSPIMRRHRSRRSFDYTQRDRPRLHLSSSPSQRTFSPPPRALTQYVSVESASGITNELTADANSIFLPSTVGLRSPAHISEFESSPPSSRHISPTMPVLNPQPRAATSSACALLSSIANRSSPSPVPHSAPPTQASHFLPSLGLPQLIDDDRTFRPLRRHGSLTADRSNASSHSPSLPRRPSTSRSRSVTPTLHHSPSAPALYSSPPLTASLEPIPPSPPSSSETEDGPRKEHKFQTVNALRKILDQQSPPQPSTSSPLVSPKPRKLPTALILSPPIPTTASTSTATASVKRLRAVPSSSPPPTPKQSSLKQSHSRSSSGRSTPRVAFAPLPPSESKGKGKTKTKGKDTDSESPSWFSSWFTNPNLSTPSFAGDRVEDRIARGGFGRPLSGLDDWAI